MPTFDWEQVVRTVQADRPDLYRSWFEQLPTAIPDRGELRVRTGDPAQAHYLNEHCRPAFHQAAMKVSGHMLSVRFVTPADDDAAITSFDEPSWSQTPLNADNTFEEFVVGPSNRLAYAACRGIASQPGDVYNPLFVHGVSGVGKTHLLQATCSELLRRMADIRVVYLSAETFVNEFIRGIETNQLARFREHVRRCDVLAIDDIQFIHDRESSQEELFHTFNALHQNRKQLLLSADNAPNQIPTLEERLVSRFNWGLVAQLDPPNRETRQAILQRKARLRGVDVPGEVLDFIAERLEQNIRVLEGALTKLISACKLGGKPMNLDTAREAIASYDNRREQRPLKVSDILEIVSMHFGVKLHDITGRKRNRSIAFPRHLAMYLARRLTPLSLEEVGGHIGGRDHSTVLHAEQLIERRRQTDAELAELISQLTKRLMARV